MPSETQRILLAVTGASGILYAERLARALGGRSDISLHMILSRAAMTVMAHETRLSPEDLFRHAKAVYEEGDIAAPPASGSWRHAGMIVCPCSMASLAAVATGTGSNLIHRAADVTLKERLPLVLVTRETPLGAVHLKNMLAAHEAGAIILPACPGFYTAPGSLEELADHLAGRILDQLSIPHELSRPWGEHGA